MLRTHRKTLIITSIVTLLPMFIGVWFWGRLPDPMATHFGIDGQPDGFSGKAIAVFVIPLFLAALEWVAALVTSRDPRRQNISPKLFTLALWLVPAVSLFALGSMYAYNLGYRADIRFFVGLFFGAMFVVLGNYLPKARQNYTIGIRIPWTLNNEENWNRTHRLAGYVWMVCGLAIIALTLCGVTPAGWTIAVMAAAVVVPMGYSYWLHIKQGRGA